MFRPTGAWRALVLLAALAAAPSLHAQVVISQVYGGGGASGAPYTHDFIELFNAGDTPVDLDGLQVAYASATGNAWNNRTLLPAVTLQPGQYFLVQQASGGSNGVALPAPDATGNISMAAANGKVALIAGTSQIPNDVCPSGPEILDLVGYGTANCPANPTGALGNSTAAVRNDGGCAHTGDNSADFTLQPPGPRNTASVAAPCNPADPGMPKMVISQVYGGGGNSGGVYTHDFVELFNAGDAPADLTGMTLRYASSSGNFPNSGDNYLELPSAIVPPGHYFLVQMAAGSNLTLPALPTPDATGNALMSGTAGKIALVADADPFTCGANATPCTPEQWARIVDLVGYGGANMFEGSGPTPVLSNGTGARRKGDGCQDTDDNSEDFDVDVPVARNSASPANPCQGGGGGDLVLTITGASVSEGDSGTTALQFTVTLSGPAPAGGVDFSATTTDGTAEAPADYTALVDAPFTVDEGETSATVTVLVNGDTEVEPDETFTVTIATSTPGVVLGTATATGTILNDDVDIVAIHTIQGSGLRSPFAPASGNGIGALVDTRGNIVTAISGNGFFMQTPDGADDNDPATSEGIFVFTGSAPAVQIGDVVDVTGNVQEYYDWTQLTNATVTVTASGAQLPTPVVLDETRPSPDLDDLSCPLAGSNFECYENMRVHVPAGVVVQGNQRFGTDPYAEAYVTASGERARREKGLLPTVTPPSPGLPVWDGNPEVFELDADGAGAVPAGTPLFGGDFFEATGVIAFQFGNYALRPTDLTIVPAEMPRAVPESAGPAELRIGSFNTLNLCEGSCNLAKVERVSKYIAEVLQLPDVVGLQELYRTDAASALANYLNSNYGTDYVAYTGSTPHGDGIRNGFLVRQSRVAVTRVRNLNADAPFDVCEGTPPCILHDRPPLLLEATFTGGDGERFAVMNNHTRSMNGVHDTGATGTRVRAKRFAQAKDIAQLVQRFQNGEELEPGSPTGDTGTVGVPLVLVGDYNAFEVTDGRVDVVGLITGNYDDAENEYQLGEPNIVDPPLLNLVDEVPLEERYSYSYAEDLGNILGESPRTVGSVQVLDHGMLNGAALPWCGGLYYGRGNADAPAELRNGTGLMGSSDHDGFVVRLFTDRLFIDDFEDTLRCQY